MKFHFFKLFFNFNITIFLFLSISLFLPPTSLQSQEKKITKVKSKNRYNAVLIIDLPILHKISVDENLNRYLERKYHNEKIPFLLKLGDTKIKYQKLNKSNKKNKKLYLINIQIYSDIPIEKEKYLTVIRTIFNEVENINKSGEENRDPLLYALRRKYISREFKTLQDSEHCHLIPDSLDYLFGGEANYYGGDKCNEYKPEILLKYFTSYLAWYAFFDLDRKNSVITSQSFIMTDYAHIRYEP